MPQHTSSFRIYNLLMAFHKIGKLQNERFI